MKGSMMGCIQSEVAIAAQPGGRAVAAAADRSGQAR
jgi:hypothetical protein